MTTPWHEEEEDVEVEDMEIRKHRDDLTESSSDEATGRKIARRKNGGRYYLVKEVVCSLFPPIPLLSSLFA